MRKNVGQDLISHFKNWLDHWKIGVAKKKEADLNASQCGQSWRIIFTIGTVPWRKNRPHDMKWWEALLMGGVNVFDERLWGRMNLKNDEAHRYVTSKNTVMFDLDFMTSLMNRIVEFEYRSHTVEEQIWFWDLVSRGSWLLSEPRLSYHVCPDSTSICFSFYCCSEEQPQCVSLHESRRTLNTVSLYYWLIVFF